MIEKMARAIAVKRGYQRNGDELCQAGFPWWMVFRDDALAALTAMLEPTEGMVAAAEKAGWDDANHMPAINMHTVAFRAAIMSALEES